MYVATYWNEWNETFQTVSRARRDRRGYWIISSDIYQYLLRHQFIIY